MRLREYLLFCTLCKNRRVFVEYGSGGSTIHLLGKQRKVFSVESNPDFYNLMSGLDIVKKNAGGLLTYRYVNLGPTDGWGVPQTPEQPHYGPDYYAGIWKEVARLNENVDAVFIDGRYRVSCCLYSILQVLEHNHSDTLFIFHDFWGRQRYHVVLEFLEEYKSTATLGSFKLKKNISPAQVKEKLAEFAHDAH